MRQLGRRLLELAHKQEGVLQACSPSTSYAGLRSTAVAAAEVAKSCDGQRSGAYRRGHLPQSGSPSSASPADMSAWMAPLSQAGGSIRRTVEDSKALGAKLVDAGDIVPPHDPHSASDRGHAAAAAAAAPVEAASPEPSSSQPPHHAPNSPSDASEAAARPSGALDSSTSSQAGGLEVSSNDVVITSVDGEDFKGIIDPGLGATEHLKVLFPFVRLSFAVQPSSQLQSACSNLLAAGKREALHMAAMLQGARKDVDTIFVAVMAIALSLSSAQPEGFAFADTHNV